MRYLNPLLGRWVSADPLAVHGLGADMNVYAYVSGSVLKNVDPLGLEEDTVSGVSFEPNQSTTEGGASDGENSFNATEAESQTATENYTQSATRAERAHATEAQKEAVDQGIADRNNSEAGVLQDEIVGVTEAVLNDDSPMDPGESRESELAKLEEGRQTSLMISASAATAPVLAYGVGVGAASALAMLPGAAPSGLSGLAVVTGGMSLGAGLSSVGEIGYAYNNFQSGGEGFDPGRWLSGSAQGGAIGGGPQRLVSVLLCQGRGSREAQRWPPTSRTSQVWL